MKRYYTIPMGVCRREESFHYSMGLLLQSLLLVSKTVPDSDDDHLQFSPHHVSKNHIVHRHIVLDIKTRKNRAAIAK